MIASSKLCEPKRFTQRLEKLKGSIEYSRKAIKWILMLQPEHGFCQQNGPKHGQLQDWYPDGKMVVVPVCFNGRC